MDGIAEEDRAVHAQRGEANALAGRILDIALAVLHQKDEGTILEAIGRSMVALFPVKRVAIYTKERDTGDWRIRFVAGYPPEQAREIMAVSYSMDSWEETLRISRKVGALSYLALGEYIVLEDFDSAFYWHLPTEAPPRQSDEQWHPYDFIDTILFDKDGKELGAIEVLETTDGRVPSAEVVSEIEILASIASIALDLSRIWRAQEELLAANSNRARVFARMLDMAARLVSLRSQELILATAAEFLGSELGFSNARAASWSSKEDRFVFLSPEGLRLTDEVLTRDLVARDCDDMFEFTEDLYWTPAAQIAEDRQAHPPFTRDGARRVLALEGGMERAEDGRDRLDLFVVPFRDRNGAVVSALYATDRCADDMFEKDLLELMGVFASIVTLAFRNGELIRETMRGNEDLDTVNRLLFHDISGYNTAIGSYLDLATSPDAPEELRAKALSVARRQLDLSNDLINRVRKLVYIRERGSEKMLTIDLVSTLASLAEEMRASRTDKALEVSIRSEESQCLIRGNELVHDLFQNLLSNSVKHDPGEVVRVDVTMERAAEGDGRFWDIAVADRGTGITDEDKERIFERFVPRSSGGGAGLGLSIVRSIVEKYGGRIWVEDRVKGQPSQGAVFHVLLPAA